MLSKNEKKILQHVMGSEVRLPTGNKTEETETERRKRKGGNGN